MISIIFGKVAQLTRRSALAENKKIRSSSSLKKFEVTLKSPGGGRRGFVSLLPLRALKSFYLTRDSNPLTHGSQAPR